MTVKDDMAARREEPSFLMLNEQSVNVEILDSSRISGAVANLETQAEEGSKDLIMTVDE